MKDREEFIESVWQKSEKAFAEEKRRKARRKKIGSFALAAACLTLIVGAANFDKLYDKLYDTTDMAYKEELNELSLSNSPTQDYESSNGDDGYRIPGNESTDDYDSTDIAVSGKPAATEKKSLITGEKSDVKKIVIENMNTQEGAVMTGEKEISGYLKWFNGLPEELILTEGDYNKSENNIKVYYKFTIEKSTGEDAEAEKDAEAGRETYYITGDVELP